MGLVGVPFTFVSSIIPVLIIALGNSSGIHVLIHYTNDVNSKTKLGILQFMFHNHFLKLLV